MKKPIRILLAIGIGLVSLGFLTVGILYFANAGTYEVMATTAHNPDLPVIEIDGYRFHGEVHGSAGAPVIIVLHGGPGGDYRGLLSLTALADNYQVVFYDQRGSGLSPRVDKSQLNANRYIEDLLAISNHFSPDRPVILIGHSWGAMLASLFIGHHPQRVAKAVLAEPGFLDNEHMNMFYKKTGLKNPTMSWESLMVMANAWGKSLHVTGPDNNSALDYLIGTIFSTEMPNHPLAGYYRDGKLSNGATEFWRYGALAGQAIPESGMQADGTMIDLAAGVEYWPGTALFIAGSENSIIGPDYQKDQMKRFLRARLVVIDGAGHTMFGEKPAETQAVIRAYLQD